MNVTTDITVHLEITETEARLLRSFVQNNHVDDEPEEFSLLRGKLFNALTEALPE
jgi:hypothetical protein